MPNSLIKGVALKIVQANSKAIAKKLIARIFLGSYLRTKLGINNS